MNTGNQIVTDFELKIFFVVSFFFFLFFHAFKIEVL